MILIPPPLIMALTMKFSEKSSPASGWAVPYTGMIISTRETKACREKVIRYGISQISGGSRTSVGGYYEPEPEEENSAPV